MTNCVMFKICEHVVLIIRDIVMKLKRNILVLDKVLDDVLENYKNVFKIFLG